MEWLFFWLVCAVIVTMIAVNKGYPGTGWFFYGFLIWPIALVHILLRPKASEASEKERAACPHCAERIRQEAKVCPHCRNDLPPGWSWSRYPVRRREYANDGPRLGTHPGEPRAAAALMQAGTTPLGATPLHRTVKHNSNPAMVAALIEAGADINARNEAGKTPLHYAARHNSNPAVIAALIDAGADIRARDKAGNFPFDDAKINEALQGTEVYEQLRRALINEDHEAPIVGR